MKNYFPFTDYDFYAYLTSGALFLAVVDFAMSEAAMVTRADWTFVQVVLAVASAYVIGHIIATFAQLIIESFLVSTVFAKPMQLQLGFQKPNFAERCIGKLVGRYYEPLDDSLQEKIKESARSQIAKTGPSDLSAEAVFQIGYRKSFADTGVRARLDSFLNQYGFCRNISFVALAATVVFTWRAVTTSNEYEWTFVILSFAVALGMFVRFIKFYSSFQAEVIRCLLIDRKSHED